MDNNKHTNDDNIDSIRHTIISWCEKHSCCPRCTLRLTGHMHFNNYLSHEVTSQKLNQMKNQSITCNNHESIPAENICVSCLDLLSPNNHSRVMTLIASKLSKLNSMQQFQSFHINIFLPVTLTLRHEIICRKLSFELAKQKESFEFAGILNVKDIFRHSLIHSLEDSLSKPFDVNSSFTISLTFTHDNLKKECDKLLECSPQSFFHKRCRKSIPSAQLGYLNQASIRRALDAAENDVIREWSLSENMTACEIEPNDVSFTRAAIYLAGRYNKYSRELSQTPWVIDGEKKMENSVQEIIEEQVNKRIANKGIKFSSSGREDVDVRMLGKGRPFVLEISDPQIDVTQITQEMVNEIMSDIRLSSKDVSVRDFQLAQKEEVNSKLKQGEESKTKTYQAMCILSREFTAEDEKKISEVVDLVIHQKTPIRVLHRRTLSTRKRTIHSMSSESMIGKKHLIPLHLSDENDLKRMFMLNLTTEAGTYVKEFVHSDFGRTTPNLAIVLGDCQADIVLLDVLQVNLDWPPQINENIDSPNDITNC